MRKVLGDVAKMDHSAYGCLNVAILMLYGADSEGGKANPQNALAVESLSYVF